MRSRTLLLVLGTLLLTPAAEAQIAHLEKGKGKNPPTLPPKPLPPWIFGSASAGTTYFGGTLWAADSARWEAIEDSCWTFDTGVGSHFQNHAWLDPFKDPSLHTSMEGWIGEDRTYSELTYFRRLSTASFPATVCVGAGGGLSGNFSFWAGVLPDESVELCYAGGQGYGNNWRVCIERSFTYNGVGSISWSFDYAVQTEAGFDYAYAIVDTTGNDDDVVVFSASGSQANNFEATLNKGSDLRSNAGTITLKFCVVTNGSNSDEDGLRPTACGAFAVDEVNVFGGGNAYSTGFEAGADGWALSPAVAGPGGDWSSLRALQSLPAPLTLCTCDVEDTVLVFEDLNIGGHGLYQDNVAVSPWIDLKAAGLDGCPGKIVAFESYTEFPLLNYVFMRIETQWYPQLCLLSGKLRHSLFVGDGLIRYFQGTPQCESYQIDFTGVVDAGAEQMRIALGVVNFCRFASNCTGSTNSTPWFDNVKLGVYGNPAAPALRLREIDLPQDAFPENGTLRADAPGRIDGKSTGTFTGWNAAGEIGDTLVVTGADADAQVHVQFAVSPGPGIDNGAFNTWLTSHAFEGTSMGLDWYSARMDTAELGGFKNSGARTWMTAYHESDPNFSGTDTNLDPGDLAPDGRQRLLNDIFPDNLFTPGTRVHLFYKTRYIAGSTWFETPAVSSGEDPLEWECLPSSMGADSTWNCVLYVDHHDGRGAEEFIEDALLTLLGTGSDNYEGTNWDRYDVRASSSDQGSLGRPLGSEYGASFYQVMAYTSILWNSGDLPAFNLVREDADVLIPWMSGVYAGDGFGNAFYGSGDDLAASMFQEAASDPSSLGLLNNYLGVDFRCSTTRDASCPVGSVRDTVSCIELVPDGASGGVNRTAGVLGRSVVHLGQGNGCPDNRSFDVIRDFASALGDPRMEEHYDGPANPPEDNAVVTNEVTGGPDYKSVLDGVSVHVRRDQTDCTYSAPPQTAVEERLDEVLTWFGIVGGATCSDRLLALDVVPAPKAYHTALLGVAPNPYRGGTAKIQFTLSSAAIARVEVFDIRGALVRELLDGRAEQGLNEVVWNGTNAQGRAVSNGVYFYRLRAEGKTFTKKVVVVQGGE